jgi:hypothetical protein
VCAREKPVKTQAQISYSSRLTTYPYQKASYKVVVTTPCDCWLPTSPSAFLTNQFSIYEYLGDKGKDNANIGEFYNH